MPQTMYFNRRREARHLCLEDPLTWQSKGSKPRCPGVTHDISFSGVGFQTPVRRGLRVGDEIEVVRRCDHRPLACRVLRIEPNGHECWHVGCRRLSATHTPVEHHPHPRPLHMAHHAQQHAQPRPTPARRCA